MSDSTESTPVASRDLRPTIVIDPANLDPAFGRLALVLRGTLEHLLGPEHPAVPGFFLKRRYLEDKSTPVIVRRCGNGLETVPVTPQYFAACIVPRVAKIEQLDRRVRKADMLSVAEARMFLASRHAQLLPTITERNVPVPIDIDWKVKLDLRLHRPVPG